MGNSSIVVLSLLLALLSCHPREQPEPVQYNAPAEVEPYVQAFRFAVQDHGRSVSTNNLIISFGTTQGEDVCGQCVLQTGKTPRIILNPDEYCWKNVSTNERECLVFHELGHCLLARTHRTEHLSNKAYVSLMNPDDIGVFATCRYPIGDDVCDKRYRRAYYVNELFDSTTATPDWGK